MLHGKVVEWQMTEEERLAYIEKHPIKQPLTAKQKGNTKGKNAFGDIHTYGERRKKK